jgi:outer membrane protein assembly factor BamB
MRPLKALLPTALGLCLLALFLVHAAAADWPQFRGPNRDGVSTEAGVLKSWPGGGPRVFWKIPLGEGFSQIVAVKDRLYTLYGQGADELATALDARTGKQLWRVRLDRKYMSDQGNGPRSTPLVDGDLVYVLSGSGQLAALKTANGQTVWRHDLPAEYGAGVPDWGISTSPLVEGNLLIVNVGGTGNRSIMAFDKANGNPVWSSQSDGAGYSAPIAVTVRGVRQVIVFAAGAVLSVAPKDGRLYWRVPWKTDWNVNAATPIFFPPDRLFVSSGYDTGSGLFQIKVAGNQVSATEIWRSRGMKNQFSSSVLHNGTVYGFDNSTLKAIDAATGAEQWKQRGLGHGSLILAGGNLVVLSDSGTLALLEATPEEYRQLGAIRVLEGKCWTAPALANGRLYLRNEEHLIALDWNAPKGAARTGK